MKRIALIGDIVASRHIKQREEIQKNLLKLLKRINKNNGTLLSPFTVTIGDEFQALYGTADSLFKDIWKIIYALYPVRARFAIGIGELSTKLNREQAIGMDGPVFHYAREGINELKKSGSMFGVNAGEKDIEALKHVLSLLSFSVSKWKRVRINIFNLMYEGKSVKEIAKLTGITDKGVYKNIDTGGMDTTMLVFEDIALQLNRIIRE